MITSVMDPARQTQRTSLGPALAPGFFVLPELLTNEGKELLPKIEHMTLIDNPRELIRECRHIHRHSRFRGNPKAIGRANAYLPATGFYRILVSRFLRNDGKRGLETDILKLTTLPSR